MSIFFWGIPFIEKCILGGLGSRKAHHFGKMEFIDLAKVVIGTPPAMHTFQNIENRVYFSHFMARGPAGCHWPRMVFNGLQPRILQNIFR